MKSNDIAKTISDLLDDRFIMRHSKTNDIELKLRENEITINHQLTEYIAAVNEEKESL